MRDDVWVKSGSVVVPSSKTLDCDKNEVCAGPFAGQLFKIRICPRAYGFRL